MANSLDAKYGRTGAIWAKIMLRLKHGRGGIQHRRVWVCQDADPLVDANSHGTYPVSIGDWAYRVDTDEVFICSVAPAASTASTFIQLHA